MHVIICSLNFAQHRRKILTWSLILQIYQEYQELILPKEYTDFEQRYRAEC